MGNIIWLLNCFSCMRQRILLFSITSITYLSGNQPSPICWSTSKREWEKGEGRERGKKRKKRKKKKGKRTRTPRRRVMTCVVWGAGLCAAPRPPRASKHVITLLRGGSQALLFLSHLVLPPPPHRKTLRKDWLNGRCEKTIFFLKPHF